MNTINVYLSQQYTKLIGGVPLYTTGKKLYKYDYESKKLFVMKTIRFVNIEYWSYLGMFYVSNDTTHATLYYECVYQPKKVVRLECMSFVIQ